MLSFTFELFIEISSPIIIYICYKTCYINKKVVLSLPLQFCAAILYCDSALEFCIIAILFYNFALHHSVVFLYSIFVLQIFTAIWNGNFALNLCIPILLAILLSICLQLCIAILYCNFALQYCIAIFHCNFSLQFCIAILHCDYVFQFYTAIFAVTIANVNAPFKGMSDEIEKTDGVYFDMSEDKRYSNITSGKTNGNVTAGKNGNDNNANATARGHTRN
jgi:hypothetical protein